MFRKLSVIRSPGVTLIDAGEKAKSVMSIRTTRPGSFGSAAYVGAPEHAIRAEAIAIASQMRTVTPTEPPHGNVSGGDDMRLEQNVAVTGGAGRLSSALRPDAAVIW